MCGLTFKEVSYQELRDQTLKWCGYFSAKYPRGTVIGFLAPNNVEHVLTLMGAMAAGMVYQGIHEVSTFGLYLTNHWVFV